jgi:hypothetical protein
MARGFVFRPALSLFAGFVVCAAQIRCVSLTNFFAGLRNSAK